MIAFFGYALKANVAMALLLMGYVLALRGSSWFGGRRAWLLGTALLPLLLPALSWEKAATETLRFTLPAIPLIDAAPSDSSIDTVGVLAYFHFGIALLLIIRLVIHVLRSFRAVRRGGDSAISFFRWAHVPDHADEHARAALVAHERAHGDLHHTYDVLLYEALAALFWSNPLWRVALRELRLVHEHQADARAVGSTADYRAILLAQALNTNARILLNRFSSSNLKTRLNMLDRTNRPQRARFLLALPLLAFSFVLTSAEVSHTTQPSEATVFKGSEQSAQFPGGMDALIQFLASRIKYPDDARKAGVEGVVHVAFTVKASGKVTDAKVKRGVREDIDAESLRVVGLMPDWKPAMSNGKAVDSEMTLPIAFRLGE